MSEGIESEADLAESLVDDGIMDWLLDKTPGESADTGSQPRDPDTGRFVPQQPQEAQEETEVVAEEEATDTEDEAPSDEETVEDEGVEDEDDEALVIELNERVQSVLDKYGGDVGKALEALAESQSLIGRQGNEVGELRKQLDEMKSMLEQRQQPQFQPYVPYQNDIEENPQGLVFEALERGDGATLHQALKAWGEVEPFEAAMFAVNLQQQMNEVQQQQAPAHPQQEVTLESAMAEVVSRHPDVEQHLPHLGKVAEEFPTLRGILENGNPSERASAFEELLKITKSRQVGVTSKEAVKRVVLKAAEEVAQEKSDARVVSATRKAPAPTTREERLESFYSEFDRAAGQLYGGNWLEAAQEG